MINRVCAAVYDLYLEYTTESTCGPSTDFVEVNHNSSSHNKEEQFNQNQIKGFNSWYINSQGNSSSFSQKSEFDLYLEKPLALES